MVRSPVDIQRVTLKFGATTSPYYSKDKPHRGLDLSPKPGDTDIGLPIYTSTKGKVVVLEHRHQFRGNYVVLVSRLPHDWWAKDLTKKTRTIKAGTLFYHCYMHLNEIKCDLGKTYDEGFILGTLGNTGIGSGAHLHFEIGIGDWAKRDVVDPLDFLQAHIKAYTDSVLWAA